MNIVSDVDLKIIKRITFENVDFVFDALFEAFHPNGLEKDKNADPRFVSLWTLFLFSVGWTEDEYWDEHNNIYHCSCGEKSEDTNNSTDLKKVN